MNLYLVVSEPLEYIVWEDWAANVGHKEPYCIAELVIARSPGQAKYMAWKTDNSFNSDIREMPKMSCKKRVVLSDEVPPHIVTKDPIYQYAWGDIDAAVW